VGASTFTFTFATLQDYLNIELDSHRNQLIQLELLLTAGMFAMAIVTLVAGLFGMNLNNKHEESYSAFVIVSSISCSECLIQSNAVWQHIDVSYLGLYLVSI
jgi:Mg2+ and Co2+ transporter CorA